MSSVDPARGDALRRLADDLAGTPDPLRADAEAAEVDAELAALRGRDLATGVRELAERHGALGVRWAWTGASGGGLEGRVLAVGPDVVALLVDGRRADVALAHVTAAAAPAAATATAPTPAGPSLLGRLRQLDVEISEVELWLVDGERVQGELLATAADHVVLEVDRTRVLVPLRAVVVVLAAPDLG